MGSGFIAKPYTHTHLYRGGDTTRPISTFRRRQVFLSEAHKQYTLYARQRKGLTKQRNKNVQPEVIKSLTPLVEKVQSCWLSAAHSIIDSSLKKVNISGEWWTASDLIQGYSPVSWGGCSTKWWSRLVRVRTLDSKSCFQRKKRFQTTTYRNKIGPMRWGWGTQTGENRAQHRGYNSKQFLSHPLSAIEH